MLLKLEKLIAKYGMKITGVIQAGSNEGNEIGLFLSNGIHYGHLFEPCDSYRTLKDAISLTGFKAYNTGLSDFNGCVGINTTNSLLKPKRHLHHYPDILFDGFEAISVNRLDRYEITDCNLLMMDVQGYELNVLKGATETLKHIDYIYTEVNVEEMYEGCALLPDLDNYLTDFTRVETKLTRKRSWGDSLYIRKRLLCK